MYNTPSARYIAGLKARRIPYHAAIAQSKASSTSTPLPSPSTAAKDHSLQVQRLDTLNDDVLLLIVQYLPYYGLRSLSSVSRHIRHLCCIRMFRELTWTWDSSQSEGTGKLDRKLIPKGLWGYMKILTFDLKDSPDTTLVVAAPPLETPTPTSLAATNVAGNNAISAHMEAAEATTTQNDTLVLANRPPHHIIQLDDRVPLHGADTQGISTAHQPSVLVTVYPPSVTAQDRAPLPSVAADATTTSNEYHAGLVASRRSIISAEDRVPLSDIASDATTTSFDPLVKIDDILPERTVLPLRDATACDATVEALTARHDLTPENVRAGAELPLTSACPAGLSADDIADVASSRGNLAFDSSDKEPSSPQLRRLRYITDTLLTVLPEMPQLRVFHFDGCDYGPWPSLLHAISQIPSLVTLEISGKPWRRTDEIFDKESFTFSTPIQRFSYSVPFYFKRDLFRVVQKTLGRRDDIGRLAETFNLSRFLPSISTNLTHLEMPTELIDAMFDIPFPALHELRISGPAPMYSEWIVEIMTQAPELLVLRLDIPQEPVDDVLTPFTRDFYDHKLMPPLTEDEAGEEIEIEEAAARSIPPNLHSFSLSSPSPKDRIFKHLPTSLTKLAFPSYPPPYQDDQPLLRQIPTSAISSTCMFEVLQAVTHLKNLTHLELSYTILDFETHDNMLRHITTSFPNLEFLEIHSHPLLDLPKQPGTGLGKDGPSTMDLLVTHLPRLSRLSHLQLNADYPDPARFIRNPLYPLDRDIVRQHTTHILSGVEALAEAVPSIQKISILKYSAKLYYWDIWDISRSSVDDKPLASLRLVNVDALWWKCH